MAENRLQRDLTTRDLSERPKQWMPPELLPEPDRQAGFSYRWVRVTINGQPDARNLSRAIREHWEPCRIEEQPRFKLLVDSRSQYKDNIEIGGLLLCKTPNELVDQRAQHYRNQTNAQTEAVDNNFMRQSDPKMPLFKERKSATSFGSGS